VDGQDIGVEIHRVYSDADSFETPQATPVHQFRNQIDRMFQFGDHEVHLFSRHECGNVVRSLCSGDAVEALEFAFPQVFENKQERVESLVLRGGSYLVDRGQVREEASRVFRCRQIRAFVVQKRLEAP
jgi:hypothetical protein